MDRSVAPEVECRRERTRRRVLGYLAPMILHETNNVLTVLAGLRQILRMGQVPSEKVGPMIDGQVSKMEELLHSLQGFSEDGGHRPAARDLFDRVEAMLRLAGKGSRLEVIRTGDERELSGLNYETVGQSLELILLASLPERRSTPVVKLELGASPGPDGGVELRAVVQPARERIDEDDLQLAGQGLEDAGLEHRVERTESEGIRVRVHC